MSGRASQLREGIVQHIIPSINASRYYMHVTEGEGD